MATPGPTFSLMRGLIFIFVLVVSLPVRAAAPAPEAVVNAFHERLLATMKDGPTLGLKGRFDRLAPEIDKAFLLSLTVRQAAGRRNWRKATADERKALVDAFRRWTVSTYASEFDAYSGQKFAFIGTHPGPSKNSTLVETRLTSPKEEPVTFTYLMVNTGQRWGIYDVLVKRGSTSISQLAKYVSEFRSIANTGVANLTRRLNEKAGDLLKPAAGH